MEDLYFAYSLRCIIIIFIYLPYHFSFLLKNEMDACNSRNSLLASGRACHIMKDHAQQKINLGSDNMGLKLHF